MKQVKSKILIYAILEWNERKIHYYWNFQESTMFLLHETVSLVKLVCDGRHVTIFLPENIQS